MLQPTLKHHFQRGVRRKEGTLKRRIGAVFLWTFLAYGAEIQIQDAKESKLVTEKSFEGRWESAFGYSLETISGPAEYILWSVL